MAKKFFYMMSLVAGLGLYGCDNLDSSVAKEPLFQEQMSAHPGTPTALTCQKPDNLYLPKSAAPLDPDLFVKGFSGDYRLKSARVYQQTADAKGNPDAAILVSVVNDPTKDAVLNIDCQESLSSSYNFDVSIPVADVIHFPSGRITVFDAGTHLDSDEFNFPSIMFLSVDASEKKQNISFAHNLKASPYQLNKTFEEWVNALPGKPQADVTPDGLIEFRLSWESQSVKTDAYLQYSKN